MKLSFKKRSMLKGSLKTSSWNGGKPLKFSLSSVLPLKPGLLPGVADRSAREDPRDPFFFGKLPQTVLAAKLLQECF